MKSLFRVKEHNNKIAVRKLLIMPPQVRNEAVSYCLLSIYNNQLQTTETIFVILDKTQRILLTMQSRAILNDSIDTIYLKQKKNAFYFFIPKKEREEGQHSNN